LQLELGAVGVAIDARSQWQPTLTVCAAVNAITTLARLAILLLFKYHVLIAVERQLRFLLLKTMPRLVRDFQLSVAIVIHSFLVAKVQHIEEIVHAAQRRFKLL